MSFADSCGPKHALYDGLLTFLNGETFSSLFPERGRKLDLSEERSRKVSERSRKVSERSRKVPERSRKVILASERG